ncbi:hypothetical protein TPHA_0E03130 [Tetrapisispora phaffii CBS 4417]|uniref:E3 ubiquitin-protein ligase n=1 Tax=Tetrapisispora phaffii (strain ATCC 24235 / CBS 4417 / NBRC 1672 / NRRL Y-8282 / UCD 70-5) TaxID=1071381 RepID=G8BU25_TETPH|nr:hypothetical protein TPHA_0E03130 [Tetrapisispora phaffii CBS 4417]CCE63403.1 hypothetical protein TPHA_0E03130 [Tetrapisispora phaffii CBS 4417]
MSDWNLNELESSNMTEYTTELRTLLNTIHTVNEFVDVRGFRERMELETHLNYYIGRILNYFLLDEGKNINYLYNTETEHDQGPFKESIEKIRNEVENVSSYIVSPKTDNNDTSSKCHAGRSCGRKFRNGEPIYRCQECGFDDTCVLCINCFEPKDHVNHHVYTGISNDNFNTGICDCGDNEAWNVTLSCKADNDLLENEKKDDSLNIFETEHNRKIFEAVLFEAIDYVIDVFNHQVEVLYPTHSEFTSFIRKTYHDITDESLRISTIRRFIDDFSYRNKSFDIEENKGYTLIVYNDEFHNYSQATTALRQGKPDNPHIDILTTRIDTEGRAVIKTSPTLTDDFIRSLFAIETNGLTAFIFQWQEYLHQESANRIMWWISQCLELENPSFQKVFRQSLTKVLCTKFDKDSTTNLANEFDFRGIKIGLSKDHFRYSELSILNEENSIPQISHKILDFTSLNDINDYHIPPNRCSSTIEVDPVPYSGLRLQYILYFDNRFWKALRKNVQSIIIPIVSSDADYKKLFSDEFLQIFSHMLRSVAYNDREPHLTIIKELIVQLLTVPTNVESLMNNKHMFEEIMWSIIDFFCKFAKVDNGQLVWQRVQISNITKSYNFLFKQSLYFIEIVLGKVMDYRKLLEPNNFITLLNFLKLFNGAWKINRKEGEHVLHEDQYFIPYLEYTTYIYNIIENFDVILRKNIESARNDPMLHGAIKILLNYLISANSTNATFKKLDSFGNRSVIKFDVSKERTTYMNPVSTLFSILVDKISIDDFVRLVSEVPEKDKFIFSADVEMRTLVLCSQVECGFWIRNGMSVLHQLSYYKNNQELDSYGRDLHVVQLGAINSCSNKEEGMTEELETFTYNMLDRWGLIECLNKPYNSEKTIYEDKLYPMIQQFIVFCYHMLTTRIFFEEFQDAEENRIEQLQTMIIYKLFSKPLSYSKLLKSIPNYLIENNNNQDFDISLEKLSIFEEPKGLSDNGVYKLKKQNYSLIDPLNMFNMGNDFESSVNIIKSKLAGKVRKPEEIIIEPYFNEKVRDERIGRFLRTTIFVNLIENLLEEVILSNNATYLYELLHLLHAIFKDYRLCNNYSNKIPPEYKSESIISSLIAVLKDSSNKQFSGNIIAKANWVLESIIQDNQKKFYEKLSKLYGSEFSENFRLKRSNEDNARAEVESEIDKKRRLAKKRQKKLMARFDNQQAKFMEEHKNSFEKPLHDSAQSYMNCSGDKGKEVTAIEDSTCVLCQDDVDNEVFIIPAYHDYSPIFRGSSKVDLYDVKYEWDGFKNDSDNLTYYDDATIKNIINSSSSGSKKVFTSCNHAIHSNCFRRFIQKKRLSVHGFICPLCQTYSNCIIPVVPSSNYKLNLSLKSIIDNSLTVNEFSELFSSGKFDSVVDKSNPLSTVLNFSIYHANSFDIDIHKIIDGKKENVTLILSMHWANTISMLEIASRTDENPQISFLITREQKYKTLKNILCFIMLIYKVYGQPDLNFKPYDFKGKNRIENQLFHYIVYNFLYSKMPLRKIVTNALSTYLRQLVKLSIDNIHELKNEKKLDILLDCKEVSPIHVSLKKRIEKIVMDHIIIDYDDKVYCLIYKYLVRSILPTLRRCLIIVKVFHDTIKVSENDTFIVDDKRLEDLLDVDDLCEYVNLMIDLLTDYESLEYLLDAECSTPSDILLKKIPIESSKIIKMANLVNNLNTYITNSKELRLREEHFISKYKLEDRLDFKICLTCGSKVHMRSDHHEMSHHLQRECFKSYGAFLVPNNNEVCLFLANPPSVVYISAPYLNSHGESGKNAMKRGDLTTLSTRRFEYLNTLWVNNEIPGYISRAMGDDFRLNILSNGFLFAMNRIPPQFRRRDDGDSDSSGEEDLNFSDEEEGGLRVEDMTRVEFEEAFEFFNPTENDGLNDDDVETGNRERRRVRTLPFAILQEQIRRLDGMGGNGTQVFNLADLLDGARNPVTETATPPTNAQLGTPVENIIDSINLTDENETREENNTNPNEENSDREWEDDDMTHW